METDTFVIAYLHSPREQWWGLLRGISAAGVTLRGLALDSFETWARAVARQQDLDMSPSTVFFPLSRIEKIYQDEATLLFPSHAQRFQELTGQDVRLHLLPVDLREH
jgi:hypothetical protein